jgi:Ni2+-binding GTPase involved in maturation of urease and hydrogenase
MKIRLILVGGFLGSGKTTLLWETARRLGASGKRTGLITNDQAPDLVDTAFLERTGAAVQEVAGSCFCCNFAGFISSSRHLAVNERVDIIIAEPVGSCTDLSATILQPLKDKYKNEFILAPLTVLADPIRLREILTHDAKSRLHKSAAYIFLKQLEEADLIVLNKTDLLEPAELRKLVSLAKHEFPGTEILCISAFTGDGMDGWLDLVMSEIAVGRKITEVDYDTYAEGEAVLGWLNAVVKLAAKDKTDWPAICRTVIAGLQAEFKRKRIEVGHIKVFLSTAGGFTVANLTSADGRISVRGTIKGFPEKAEMIINARAQMPPDKLEQLVRRILAEMTTDSMKITITHLQSLSPVRPRPTHRYTSVV